jgi:diphthine methyl ester acylhydrolase
MGKDHEREARLHQEIMLDLHADVVAWCPSPGSEDVLAVGTYQLNEETRLRDGRLYLYELAEDGPGSDSTTCAVSLRQLATVDVPGIFDLCWKPWSAQPLLAAALSDGSLRLFAVSRSSEGDTSCVELAASPAREDSLATCVDYSRAGNSPGSLVAASFSCGSLQVFQVRKLSPLFYCFILMKPFSVFWQLPYPAPIKTSCHTSTHPQATPTSLMLHREWQGHELEAWAAAFSYSSPDVLYSGGDDCRFAAWDLRQGGAVPAWVDRRTHGAGVCCISPCPQRPHLLCTGSYDEFARLWDVRMPERPVMSTSARCAGGAWRLEWHPRGAGLLLAASMQGGFEVIQLQEGAGGEERCDSGGAKGQEPTGLEVVEAYAHQRTLAYGADWCRRQVGGADLVATCSFYDRLLHVWAPATTAALHVDSVM